MCLLWCEVVNSKSVLVVFLVVALVVIVWFGDFSSVPGLGKKSTVFNWESAYELCADRIKDAGDTIGRVYVPKIKPESSGYDEYYFVWMRHVGLTIDYNAASAVCNVDRKSERVMYATLNGKDI